MLSEKILGRESRKKDVAVAQARIDDGLDWGQGYGDKEEWKYLKNASKNLLSLFGSV